jgi:hypothetical protein
MISIYYASSVLIKRDCPITVGFSHGEFWYLWIIFKLKYYKGQPEKVKLANRPPRKRRLKGARGRGTLANEKPPVFGMSQRSGEVVMRMLENVKQTTLAPLILKTVSQGTQIYTQST